MEILEIVRNVLLVGSVTFAILLIILPDKPKEETLLNYIFKICIPELAKSTFELVKFLLVSFSMLFWGVISIFAILVYLLSRNNNGLEYVRKKTYMQSRKVADYFLNSNTDEVVGVCGHRARHSGEVVVLDSGKWVINKGARKDDGDYVWIVDRV